MVNWRTSLKRKKHQQVINKIVRAINKNIQNDPAWLGRFEMRQIHNEFVVFDDKSGAYMICFLELIDKKTRKGKIVRIEESQFFDSNVWGAMNDFICDDLEIPAWSEPVEDFRDVEIPVHSLPWWCNHWHQIVEV